MANQEKLPKRIKSFGTRVIDRIKNWPWKIICLLGLTVVFFSFTLVITYDGGHYLNYVAIFEHELPANSWDIVRGPVFPLILYSFDVFFGKSASGMLVGMYIIYILFSIICYLIIRDLFRNLKHKKILQTLLIIFVILNPIIFGYFHVMLTEYIAITLTVLNIYLAYKWLGTNSKNTKQMVLFGLYFVLEVVFGFHLKQPYVAISFAPLIIAGIISIVKEHKVRNILFRIGTVLASLVMLFASIIVWGKITDRIGSDNTQDRDSGSIMNSTLLNAAQIYVDNDGDGKYNNNISITETIGILLKDFGNDPMRLFKIYAMNYCGSIGLCKITTEDGVGFLPTDEIVWGELYETVFIPYQLYRESEDISAMPAPQLERAMRYSSYHAKKSHLKKYFIRAESLTNLVYKFSLLLALPCFVAIFFVRKKDHERKFDNIFHLLLLLFGTTILHSAFASITGLIIDRYSAPVFVPAVIGIAGFISYIFCVLRSSKQNVI